MNNHRMLYLSGLVIGLAFSVLLVRLAFVERKVSSQRERLEVFYRFCQQQQASILDLQRENARQREQIAVLRETATQAREAFKRIQYPILRSLEDGFGWEEDASAKKAAIKSLDAEIQTLERVSKER